VPRVLRN